MSPLPVAQRIVSSPTLFKPSTRPIAVLFLAWIFQVTGTLSIGAGQKVVLAGGALSSNIVWVVTGAVSAAAGAHLEGVILGQTSITLLTGATANSRLLAQTSVVLQKVCVLFLLCKRVVDLPLGYCHQLNYRSLLSRFAGPLCHRLYGRTDSQVYHHLCI